MSYHHGSESGGSEVEKQGMSVDRTSSEFPDDVPSIQLSTMRMGGHQSLIDTNRSSGEVLRHGSCQGRGSTIGEGSGDNVSHITTAVDRRELG